MDVDTPSPTDKGTTFSPPAVKEKVDMNAETIDKGSTTGGARPATIDVATQTGSKHRHGAVEVDGPLTATQRKMAENLRRIKDNKKKSSERTPFQVCCGRRWVT